MVGVIAYLLTAAPDSEKCLAGVRRHMIRGDRGSSEMVRQGIDSLAIEAAEELWTKSMEWDGEGYEWNEEEDKSAFYRKAIYTSASIMLTDFADKVLESQTAVSDFDPGDLVSGDRPLTVIISTMPSDAQRLRRVFKLIYTQIINRLTEDRKHVCGMPRRWDVLLGIDEFLEFKIKEVSSWLTYLREYGVRPVFLAQSFESVIEAYQKVIASSAIWVAFAPMSIFEADIMSRMIGERDELVESQSKTKKNWFETASVTESTRLEMRPEKTPSDLMDTSKDELFIFGLGRTINAQCCLAFSRYPDAYGPASRNWTSPISSNPWHGRFLPVPPRPKEEEEEDGKQEKGGKQINEPRASLNTKSLLKGIRK
jgi:type IV secretory pathway TraG/TraD family ATPase VirD4